MKTLQTCYKMVYINHGSDEADRINVTLACEDDAQEGGGAQLRC